MTQQFTVSQVVDLQNQKKQLEQRLEVHKKRAEEKREELSKLFAQEGVNSIEELSQICNATNLEMQKYAEEVSKQIKDMREACDELDRLL